MPSTRSADPTRLPARIFAFGGLLCLAVLTLLDRGATRQFSTPWELLLRFAELAPFAVLVLRANSGPCPFVLPGRAWCVCAAAAVVVILASALASPYRGSACLNALPLLSGIAAFFCLHDWIHRTDDSPTRSAQLITAAGLAAFLIATVSLLQWLGTLLTTTDKITGIASLLIHRNDHPLGHSNYTAGLALLALPWPAALALRTRGLRRATWLLVTLFVLVMLFTSGSRGGLLGLAVLAAGMLLCSGLGWKKILLWCCVATAAALAFAFAHPRTRAMLFHQNTTVADPNGSDIQRSEMATAGFYMGLDRLALGWGAGTTPLVYPRYRAELGGGVENVLQLHSTLLQFWADFGGLGLVVALIFLMLVTRDRKGCRPAFLALLGYAAFALTDWQLDLPIFAFTLAVCAALLALPAPETRRPRLAPLLLTAAAFATLLCIGIFGQRDLTPALNLRALALARDPAQADRAAALFRESLALNPDQEIAHFNLGWLLITRDPAAAETHFLAAAKLVPDKGGVYFGLGLARLNARQPSDTVIRALALECLNDPLFLTSPWWREPSLHVLQADTFSMAASVAEKLGAGRAISVTSLGKELNYFVALTHWLERQEAPGRVLAAANTSARVSYFARRTERPDFDSSPIRQYRRERTGYPVLMRNLDLPVPVDLFDVQENVLAATEFSFLFPAKGWLSTSDLPEILFSPTSNTSH